MTTNAGALAAAYATVAISALTNANNEPWNPDANTGLTDAKAVDIVGYDSADTYTVEWDHTQDAFVFATTADGSNPGAGTDVGEVKVRVEGRR